jgi:hypothetical protein
MFENGTIDPLAKRPNATPDFAARSDLAEEYSGRQLAKDKDELPAIVSLAKSLHRSIGLYKVYTVGLWSGDIVQELS